MSTTGGTAGNSTVVAGLATDVKASSGVVVNTPAVATIPAVAGKLGFLVGFDVSITGATAALEVTVVVNFGGAVWSYPVVVPAGVTSNVIFFQRSLHRPAPADAVNTAITVTCPAAGSGDIAVCVNAHGYQQ